MCGHCDGLGTTASQPREGCVSLPMGALASSGPFGHPARHVDVCTYSHSQYRASGKRGPRLPDAPPAAWATAWEEPLLLYNPTSRARAGSQVCAADQCTTCTGVHGGPGTAPAPPTFLKSFFSFTAPLSCILPQAPTQIAALVLGRWLAADETTGQSPLAGWGQADNFMS